MAAGRPENHATVMTEAALNGGLLASLDQAHRLWPDHSGLGD